MNLDNKPPPASLPAPFSTAPTVAPSAELVIAAPGAPPPQRRVIGSKAEFAAAVTELTGMTKRTLRVFAPSLDEFGFNTPQREEQLRNFLLAGRKNRLLLVMHETHYVSTACPRLLRLLRQYSHAISIHQTNDTIRNLEDALLIVDEAHCIRKPHADRPSGTVYVDDPVETREWLNRFNAIWEQSTPSVSATTIGL